VQTLDLVEPDRSGPADVTLAGLRLGGRIAIEMAVRSCARTGEDTQASRDAAGLDLA
jgi:hypothetical protein